jgi:hypothetical protein
MRDKTGTPRPRLFRAIRATEALGLLMLLYGLASSRWLVAATGAGTVVAAYFVYRRWFPLAAGRDDASTGMSDGGD